MIITDTELILKLNHIKIKEYFLYKNISGHPFKMPNDNKMIVITENVPEFILNEIEKLLEKYQDDYANNKI